jgi:predicted permease
VPQLTAMYRTLEDRLNRIPGVQSANLALYNPLTDNWGELILVAGHPPPKPGDNAGASWVRVSAHYLQNLGMTMTRGRTFTEADNETTAPVAIVNEAFVKRFFKSDEDPIGQHFGLDEPQNVGTFTIVGVVRNARWQSFQFRQPVRPMFYVPLAQNVNYVNSVMTRVEYQSHFIGGLMLVTTLGPGALEPLVTKTMADVDPNLTFMNARTLEQQIALTFDQDRAVASLAGLFGGVSLLLAAIGLYGVTAYSVAQRTNEIGIRMALGAGKGAVMNLVLRSAFTRVAIGLGIGVPLAIGAGKLLAAQLYGVKFWDPVALAVAALSLTLCALVAALIPGTRAASIAPMRALRLE